MIYGILGAGQLSQMLANAAETLGLQVRVLEDWKDPISLGKFLNTCDHFVFENEFVPEASFKSLGISFSDPRFFPRLSTMMRIQDKLEQKKIFASLGLPTSPYRVEESWSLEKLKAAASDFPAGFVLKWSRLGYDGKGTWISPDILDTAAFEAALAFAKTGEATGAPVYLEEKVRFVRELAVVGCLSVTGEWKNYPVVISEQKSGVCHQAYGPAERLAVPTLLCEKIAAAAEKIARNSEIHGAMALEVFQINEHDYWINEIAPRVHNSGHYTLDGGITSQFENHWRAITGMPLGNTHPDLLFFMRNILGEAQKTSERKSQKVAASVDAGETYRFHWYGKTEVRPGRKMGHVNYWNLNLKQLNQIRGMK